MGVMQRGFPVLAASVRVRASIGSSNTLRAESSGDGAGQGSVMVSFDGVGIGSHLEGFLDALQVVVGDGSKIAPCLVRIVHADRISGIKTSLLEFFFVGIPRRLFIRRRVSRRGPDAARSGAVLMIIGRRPCAPR